MKQRSSLCPFFFFNDTATTEIYTLSLHDALPISEVSRNLQHINYGRCSCSLIGVVNISQQRKSKLFFHLGQHLHAFVEAGAIIIFQDRKSTRLNSSHLVISYAVFCLKKKTRPVTS